MKNLMIVFLSVVLMMVVAPSEALALPDAPPTQQEVNAEYHEKAWIDIAIWSARILTYIAVFILLAAMVYSLVIDSSGGKSSLVSFGLVVVFGLLGFALSSGEFDYAGVAEAGLSSMQVKLIGGGLISFYILLVVAFLSIAVSEVANAFK